MGDLRVLDHHHQRYRDKMILFPNSREKKHLQIYYIYLVLPHYLYSSRLVDIQPPDPPRLVDIPIGVH